MEKSIFTSREVRQHYGLGVPEAYRLMRAAGAFDLGRGLVARVEDIERVLRERAEAACAAVEATP